MKLEMYKKDHSVHTLFQFGVFLHHNKLLGPTVG